MARKGGSKEGFSHDPSINMPSEQRTSESNKQKISRIHDMFPNAKKEHIAVILQFYDDDESKAIDAITRDGGREALSHVTETGSLKNKNNKNKKKKKKPKKDVTGMATTASFDADDSSSLHSSGNVDADIEKECQRVENGNGFLTDAVDEVENLNTTLTNHERLKDNEPESLDTRSAISTPECDVIRSVTTTIYEKSNAMQHKQDIQSTPCGSPLSDYSEKQEELKKDRNKSINEHYKQTSRQRTSSFRRSKTSSLSEDSSSQHNPPNMAANKRGIERCKKDLNRQTVSLQRIHSQVEKGLEESAKKIKNVFGELQKLIESRRKEVESELEKRKEEALNLIKSRQDLAVELKRRVDRSPSMTDNEWMDLRTDIKLFVTERKYDEDFGKTIWFQWADISDSIKSFGEVQPVKNVYSQRSNSVLTSRETSQNNHPEPSPSSSLANEDIDSAADKNDVAVIADAVEDESLPPKEEAPSINKNRPHDNKTYDRVYSSKRFGRYNNRFQNNRGNFRGSRGGGYTRANYNRNNYTNYRHNNYYDDYRSHTHQERDGRANENQSYSGNERNNNYKDNKNNPGRGHSNYRYNNPRFKEYPGHRNSVDNANLTESSTKPMDVNAGKSGVVNGIENN